MAMFEPKQKPMEDERYDVTVWDLRDGDIVKKLWEAAYEEAEEVREQYADEPFYDVQIEEKD